MLSCSLKSRLIYSGVILLPTLIGCAILPLIFYQFPIYAHTSINDHGTNVAISLHQNLYALSAILTWFGLVFLIAMLPASDRTTARPWPKKLLWPLFILFAVVGLFALTIKQVIILPTTLMQSFHILSLATIVSIVLGLSIFEGYSKNDNLCKKIIVLTLVIAIAELNIFIPLMAGKAAATLYISLVIIFIMLYKRIFGRKTTVIVGLIMFALLVFNLGIKTQLRRAHIHDQYIHLNAFFSTNNKCNIMLKAFCNKNISQPPSIKSFSNYDPNYFRIRLEPFLKKHKTLHYYMARTLARANHVTELAYVMKQTPKYIPFSLGKTYRPFEYLLIPRLLFRHKPKENTGQFFGHHYHFILSSDHVTSQNLPIFTEGYINFGWYGIIGSALLFGLILRIVWQYLIGNNRDESHIIFGALIVYICSQIESNLFLAIGSLIDSLIVYGIIDVLIKRLGKSIK